MLDLEELKRGVREDVKAIMAGKPFPFIRHPISGDDVAARRLQKENRKEEIKKLILGGFSKRVIAAMCDVPMYYVQDIRLELKNDNLLPKAVLS